MKEKKEIVSLVANFSKIREVLVEYTECNKKLDIEEDFYSEIAYDEKQDAHYLVVRWKKVNIANMLENYYGQAMYIYHKQDIGYYATLKNVKFREGVSEKDFNNALQEVFDEISFLRIKDKDMEIC